MDRDDLEKLADLLKKLNAQLDNQAAPSASKSSRVCTALNIPPALIVKAARSTLKYQSRSGSDETLRELESTSDPHTIMRIAAEWDWRWGQGTQTLTVSFMEQLTDSLKRRILEHMNAWDCGIGFALTNGNGVVRITTTGNEYKSYVGRQVLNVPSSSPTMWLGGFTDSFPEDEFHRLARHETGHTLGFVHEHMRKEIVERLDPQGCYAYFSQFGWSPQVVNEQVLTPLNSATLTGTTNADEMSIMCYQLPAICTRDGQGVSGGTDINAVDRWFANRLYPKPSDGRGLTSHREQSTDGGWGTAEFLSEPRELD